MLDFVTGPGRSVSKGAAKECAHIEGELTLAE